MPRILILSNRVPYPLHDGGARAMDALIRGYQGAGWQVQVLAMNTTRHPVAPATLARLYPQLAGFHTVEVDNRIRPGKLLQNLLFSREPEHVPRFRNEAFAARLQQLLVQEPPDFVQLESPFLAAYIQQIRAASAARLVYRAHNIEYQIWERLAQKASGPKGAYLRNLARRMAVFERGLWQAVDFIVPITEADAALIRAGSPGKPLVVAPYGLELPAVAPVFPPLPLRVYHIGAMDWLPNQEALEWFLKAVWPELHARVPELSFHFAGRAMPRRFSQGLPPQVFCAGEVADAEAFVADKHLLVVPLRSGSGIRVKSLEGMAEGKLVLSTAVGMQGIEAEAGKQYLRAETAAEFVERIAWAAAHLEAARELAAAGCSLVRAQYDAGRIMQKLTAALCK